jgi:hypothetical protein
MVGVLVFFQHGDRVPAILLWVDFSFSLRSLQSFFLNCINAVVYDKLRLDRLSNDNALICADYLDKVRQKAFKVEESRRNQGDFSATSQNMAKVHCEIIVGMRRTCDTTSIT